MEPELKSAVAASSWNDQNYIKSLAYYINLSDRVSFNAFSFNMKMCLKKLNISYSEINQDNESFISRKVICRIGYLLGNNHGRHAELSFFQYLQALNQNCTWIWEAILTINLRIDNKYLPDENTIATLTSSKEKSWAKKRLKKLKIYRNQFKKMNTLAGKSKSIGKKIKRSGNKTEKIKLAYCLHFSLPESSNGYAVRSQGVAQGLNKHLIDITCLTRPGAPWDDPNFDAADEPELSYTIDNIKYEKLKEPNRKKHVFMDYFELASEATKAKIRQLNCDCVMAGSNPSLLSKHWWCKGFKSTIYL